MRSTAAEHLVGRRQGTAQLRKSLPCIACGERLGEGARKEEPGQGGVTAKSDNTCFFRGRVLPVSFKERACKRKVGKKRTHKMRTHRNGR